MPSDFQPHTVRRDAVRRAGQRGALPRGDGPRAVLRRLHAGDVRQLREVAAAGAVRGAVGEPVLAGEDVRRLPDGVQELAVLGGGAAVRGLLAARPPLPAAAEHQRRLPGRDARLRGAPRRARRRDRLDLVPEPPHRRQGPAGPLQGGPPLRRRLLPARPELPRRPRLQLPPARQPRLQRHLRPARGGGRRRLLQLSRIRALPFCGVRSAAAACLVALVGGSSVCCFDDLWSLI